MSNRFNTFTYFLSEKVRDLLKFTHNSTRGNILMASIKDQMKTIQENPNFEPRIIGSVLDKCKQVPELYEEPHINLNPDMYSHGPNAEDVELGRKLSPFWFRKFEYLGNIYPNMDFFMNTINIARGDLREKIRPSASRSIAGFVRRNKYKKIHLPNYWALVTDAMIASIKKDEKLMAMLYESKAPFTMYSMKDAEVHGCTYSVVEYNPVLAKYVGMMEEIRTVLKKGGGVFDNDLVLELLENIKADKEADMLEGIMSVLFIKEKDGSNKQQDESA